jgi:hypothetical protein
MRQKGAQVRQVLPPHQVPPHQLPLVLPPPHSPEMNQGFAEVLNLLVLLVQKYKQ